jgi:integrase
MATPARKRRAPGRSLVTWRGGVAYQNFSVHGRRFRECLGTRDPAEAEARALQDKSAALLAGPGQARKGKAAAEITLDEALARYCIETGQYKKTADDIHRFGRALIQGLGGDTRLSSLDFGTLSSFIATRRVRKARNSQTGKVELRDRANASINRELGHLRTVVLSAARWGHKVPRIEWRHLFLEEPENVQLVLSETQEEKFFHALRPDFHALVAFALATGLRLENLIGLRWDQVDFDAGVLTVRTKSKKPGGQLHVLPLTRGLLAILGAERGRDPVFVFTYVCARTRHERHSGLVQWKGERYPFTKDGWRKEWDRARRIAGVPALRFHDLRHTAATRALRAHRDLKTVQRLLGHADIQTTLRYTASDTADVRAAMEAVEAQSRHKKLTQAVSGG